MYSKRSRRFKSKCFQHDYRNKWIGNINIYHANVNVNLMVEKIQKKHICERDYIRNPAICSSKNGKYLASIIDDSVIRFRVDAIIEKTKTV